MRQITQLFEVEDGRRYLILQVRNGKTMTGICRANVTSRMTGGFVSNLDINFVQESGDLDARTSLEKGTYITELDA
jgi:hypothetical protein